MTDEKQQYYTTPSAVARAAGVTPKVGLEWVKRETFPAKAKGKGWPVEAVDAWAIDALKEAAAQQTGPNKDLKAMLLQKRVDKLVEDIEARKIENQKARGDLEPKSNRVQALTMYAGIVRRALETMPKDLAEMLENASARKIVQDKVDAVLKQIDSDCSK